MKKELPQTGYGQLLVAIKERIRQAQYQALRAVNRELIALYWDIGKMIVERQKQRKWGSGIVEKISRDLRRAFPESRGFSAQNLWRMRQFYEAYRGKSILSILSRELPWFHNLLIMNKASSDREKEYYLRASVERRWSFRELDRQIKASDCERTGKIPRKNSLKPGSRKNAVLAHFRSEYVLDLLELKNRPSEKKRTGI